MTWEATYGPHFSPAICCAEPKYLAGLVSRRDSILSV